MEQEIANLLFYISIVGTYPSNTLVPINWLGTLWTQLANARYCLAIQSTPPDPSQLSQAQTDITTAIGILEAILNQPTWPPLAEALAVQTKIQAA